MRCATTQPGRPGLAFSVLYPDCMRVMAHGCRLYKDGVYLRVMAHGWQPKMVARMYACDTPTRTLLSLCPSAARRLPPYAAVYFFYLLAPTWEGTRSMRQRCASPADGVVVIDPSRAQKRLTRPLSLLKTTSLGVLWSQSILCVRCKMRGRYRRLRRSMPFLYKGTEAESVLFTTI